MRTRNQPHGTTQLEVYVDQSYPPAELARIIEDLQRKYSDREDGYFVQINCDAGNTTTHNNNRLATAKFAVGKLGAARTGLDVGEHEITEVLGAKCPPDLPTSTVSGPSAQDVIDAVVAAGLPATDPRDNSAGICSNAGRVQLITTDEFSVYQFPDLASVERWASTYPSRYVHGTIMLRFTESGSAPTDPALIPQYDAVLDQLMAAGG